MTAHLHPPRHPESNLENSPERSLPSALKQHQAFPLLNASGPIPSTPPRNFFRYAPGSTPSTLKSHQGFSVTSIRSKPHHRAYEAPSDQALFSSLPPPPFLESATAPQLHDLCTCCPHHEPTNCSLPSYAGSPSRPQVTPHFLTLQVCWSPSKALQRHSPSPTPAHGLCGVGCRQDNSQWRANSPLHCQTPGGQGPHLLSQVRNGA